MRVRVETDRGWSDWSDPLVVETGLLDSSEWQASWISTGADAGHAGHRPADRMRGELHVASPVRRARLYATASPASSASNPPGAASASSPASAAA